LKKLLSFGVVIFLFIIITPILIGLYTLLTSWPVIGALISGDTSVLETNLNPQDTWGSNYKNFHQIQEFTYSENELTQVENSQLTGATKNFYKLSFLFKNHLKALSSDNPMTHLFMLGIISTEAGGSFYNNGGSEKDIFIDPSDKFGNTYVGAFGINKASKISFSTPYTTELLTKYPVPTDYKGFELPADVEMESLFIPTSSYIATSIFLSKSAEFEADTRERVAKLAPSFGITNVKALSDFAVLYIGQAQYHGASVDERDAYLSFLCGVYKLSGEDFTKLKIVTDNASDFSEATIRKQILGLSGISNLPSLPSQLGYVTGNQKISLGGLTLNEPLWSYVYDKFPENEHMINAWSTAVNLSNSDSSGMKARVLNFHYGLVSYMQGQRIEGLIKGSVSNISLEVLSGGSYNGKSITELFNEYNSQGKVNSYLRGIYSNLSPYFGVAKNKGVVKGKETFGTTVFTRLPSKYNIPFYSQQPKSSGIYEDWGTLKYGSIGTFEQNGCHIYSFAYGASAITGRLINPPEMAIGMYLVGGLDPSGLLQTGPNGDNIKPLMDMLGITGYRQGIAPNFNALFDEIDQALKSGGVVILRGKNGSNRIAYGDSHFIVLEDIRELSSGKEYLMYTSSKLGQNTWQKKSFFGGNNLYNRQFYILKK
jgi:hypothetical protein